MIKNVISAPTLTDIRAAAKSLAPYIVRTPLVQLDVTGRPGNIYLKLENLQPIGAFKVRPMGNAMLARKKSTLRGGVYTASSGNAGLGLAWMAEKLRVAATVYVPDSALSDKLAAIGRFGAQIKSLSESDWWQVIENGGYADDPGVYVDAVRHPAAMAGNATIGLEIIEQLPDVATVIVPFGGGGLMCGIAAAIRALKPDTRIVVAESDAATPLTSALAAGRPVPLEVKPSIVSGAGAPMVLSEMWPLVRQFADDTVVSPVSEVAQAIRVLFEHSKIVAEGAGAISVAAALADDQSAGKTVCVVSGGNIDSQVMAGIFRERSD